MFHLSRGAIRRYPQITMFEEKGQPKGGSNRGPSAYQPNALPLGQIGSRRSALRTRPKLTRHGKSHDDDIELHVLGCRLTY